MRGVIDEPRDIMRERRRFNVWFQKDGPIMLITGLVLVAAAGGGLWMALPRDGKVQRFVGNDLVENVIAFLVIALVSVASYCFWEVPQAYEWPDR